MSSCCTRFIRGETLPNLPINGDPPYELADIVVSLSMIEPKMGDDPQVRQNLSVERKQKLLRNEVTRYEIGVFNLRMSEMVA